ncbi:MAG: type II toxin-antitoxin system PemK/MazF family toxin [Caulobacteraceae bacterium]
MRRGDVLTVVAPGEYGKPRPAVVIQSNRLAHLDSVIVCLFTSDLDEAPTVRVAVAPTPGNGLRKRSEVMVDKIMALHPSRIGQTIGALDPAVMDELDQKLAFVIGLDG